MRPSYMVIITILSIFIVGLLYAIFYDPVAQMYVAALANGNYPQFWSFVKTAFLDGAILIAYTFAMIIWYVVNSQRPGTGGEGE